MPEYEKDVLHKTKRSARSRLNLYKRAAKREGAPLTGLRVAKVTRYKLVRTKQRKAK